MKNLVMVAMAIALLAACSKDAKKAPSEDALLAEEAFALAERLREDYTDRDFYGIKKLSTPAAYEAVMREVKEFRSVELEFQPRWVEIKQDGVVHLYVSWSGTWNTEGGTRTERKGMALFELRERPLKLSGIIRGSPFGQPD